MQITSSLFFKSIVHAKDAPQGKPSFAMIGRSNVGKSSLINKLLGRKHLARTSATPGKTEVINYFLVNDRWFLVDLPGYGWAKVSKADRLRWKKMVTAYLSEAALQTIFLLIDSRHPLQALDLSFIAWLDEAGLPYAVVLTKGDKCKAKAVKAHIQQLERTFVERMWRLPLFFVTSSKAQSYAWDGCSSLLRYIEEQL